MCAEVLLRTKDGKNVSVDRSVIRKSLLIDNMLQDLQEGESGDSTTLKDAIPLEEVEEATLMKVLEWCEHHKDDPSFVTKNEDGDEMLPDELPEWDQKYLRMEPNLLFDVVLVGVTFALKCSLP
ncbi:unnamed protein product [Anisakis simplex]|uniref:Skp1-related protein n=1 Tax=Anisakis simplex TaxID=6269 RepID=A0A0M3J4W5_ANISI|nr:unnamed protein product [Anisakis simplex]